MTLQELKRDLKKYVGGGGFISPGQIASYTGQKKTEHVRKYYIHAGHLEGTNKYFIDDVARAMYDSSAYD